jgi:hypothetical protein
MKIPPSSVAIKNKWSYTSTTLLAAQNKKLRMTMVNNQPEKMRMETVVGLFQVPARYLSELRKTMRNGSRKSQSQG